MQRKGGILMNYQQKRNAFSMFTAIIVIILMATVAMFIMSISEKIVKETTSQYQKEQAALLAKSYTEYAIMAVTANDRNATVNRCLSDINGTIGSPSNGGYSIRTSIAYIGHADEVNNCEVASVFSSGVNNANSPLNIIVDVYVDYQDFDSTNMHMITYHKRTLQKI